MRLKAGDAAPDFTWPDTEGKTVSLSDLRGGPVLLSFYRYASCPFCNLRIHELARRAAQYGALGLEMLAVFQSPAEKIREYVGRQDPAFPILPDPARVLYRLYGVESSWLGMAKAFASRVPEIARAVGKGFLPGSMEGEAHRLPADFLIGRDGSIAIAYYGKDIGDHLPLVELDLFLSRP